MHYSISEGQYRTYGCVADCSTPPDPGRLLAQPPHPTHSSASALGLLSTVDLGSHCRRPRPNARVEGSPFNCGWARVWLIVVLANRRQVRVVDATTAPAPMHSCRCRCRVVTRLKRSGGRLRSPPSAARRATTNGARTRTQACQSKRASSQEDTAEFPPDKANGVEHEGYRHGRLQVSSARRPVIVHVKPDYVACVPD